MTPLQFVTRQRIARAQQLIRETSRSQIEIALEVGYTSPSHFAQVFRRKPALRRAITGGSVDALLDQGAREYVNHPRGVALVDGELRVSSIYVSFQEDFGGSAEGLWSTGFSMRRRWRKRCNPIAAASGTAITGI